jgi:hypothetical protein
MVTLAEHLNAIASRADVINVSLAFPPQSGGDILDADGNVDQAKIDKHDLPRRRLGMAARRRVEIIREDKATGKRRIFYEDFGVIDLGGAGETVVEHGAGDAKEPANPENAFRQTAETWLTANANNVDPKIVKWWITSVDEDRQIVFVSTIYAPDAGTYAMKDFIALRAGGVTSLRAVAP